MTQLAADGLRPTLAILPFFFSPFRLPPVYSGVSPVILYMCTADGAPPVRPSQPATFRRKTTTPNKKEQ